MEKKRKHNFLIKSLILCDLQTYVFSFYAFLFFRSLADAEYLFTDAEFRKYVIKYILWSYGSCNFHQVIINLT